ncbi:hypothetical protein OUZ56_030348 [Daphnia magna]|uniref:Uncharacterized protein n=1 Tax=Daphnia magna TaxID=35525 RepID=A0ABQ9ZRH1_9CRUS|nr:hypothetical protein OUZ56_030348 [Daphnia magna]
MQMRRKRERNTSGITSPSRDRYTEDGKGHMEQRQRRNSRHDVAVQSGRSRQPADDSCHPPGVLSVEPVAHFDQSLEDQDFLKNLNVWSSLKFCQSIKDL